MEYTKDMIFNIKYNEENNCIEIVDKRFTKRMQKFFKNNKAISIITLISMGLIIWDIALISNFINLLTKL